MRNNNTSLWKKKATGFFESPLILTKLQSNKNVISSIGMISPISKIDSNPRNIKDNFNCDSQKDSKLMIKENKKDNRAKKIVIHLNKEKEHLESTKDMSRENSKIDIPIPSLDKFIKPSPNNCPKIKIKTGESLIKKTMTSKNLIKISPMFCEKNKAVADENLRINESRMNYPQTKINEGNKEESIKTNNRDHTLSRNIALKNEESFNKFGNKITFNSEESKILTEKKIENISKLSIKVENNDIEQLNLKNIIEFHKKSASPITSNRLVFDEKSDKRIITYGMLFDFISTNLREINEIVEKHNNSQEEQNLLTSQPSMTNFDLRIDVNNKLNENKESNIKRKVNIELFLNTMFYVLRRKFLLYRSNFLLKFKRFFTQKKISISSETTILDIDFWTDLKLVKEDKTDNQKFIRNSENRKFNEKNTQYIKSNKDPKLIKNIQQVIFKSNILDK